MDMVAHDAEIMYREAVFLFSPFQDVEEELSHGGAVEDHLSPIGTGGNVIDGILFQYSRLSHTSTMGLYWKFALIGKDVFQFFSVSIYSNS